MSVILDLVLAAIIVVTLINGYRKGFIKTLFGLVGVLLALIVASMLAAPVGGFINDSFAQDALEEVISNSLSQSFEEEDINGLVEKIADYAPTEEMAETLTDTFMMKGGDAIDSISADLAEKLSVPMCNAVAFFIVFVLAYFAVKLASGLLDGICKLPILNFANSWLGLAVGAVSAILIAMVLSRSFECMLPWLCNTYPESFSEGIIDNTVLLNFFCRFNLFGALIVGVSGLIK